MSWADVKPSKSRGAGGGDSQQRRPGRPARLSRAQILWPRGARRPGRPRGGDDAAIARAIGAEPMSLYRHVRNKEDLLDGLVDLVFAEIELPSPDDPWRVAMRRRAVSVREALGRHPWAIGLMESRTHPGSATLAYHDAPREPVRRRLLGQVGDARHQHRRQLCLRVRPAGEDAARLDAGGAGGARSGDPRRLRRSLPAPRDGRRRAHRFGLPLRR